MRLILLLALSSALSIPAVAQTSPPSRVALPGDNSVALRPTDAEPRGALSLVERPSERVARLVRTALLAPGDSSTWRALAGALPELALDGPAD
ncbi:MAG: hypothetical protein FIA95_00280, partial [Gemmatimonadetes bacterium]|nr:hypothetical protein [Gemmatimonadota bacterium]